MSRKTSFVKPNTMHSFRKDDRVFPPSINLDTQHNIKKSAIEIEQQIVQAPRLSNLRSSPLYLSTNPLIDRFKFSVLDPFPIKQIHTRRIVEDQHCLWHRYIDYKSGLPKSICFGKTNYVLKNWATENFPSIIYVCIKDFSGYLDIHGSVTNRIAALNLVEIQTTIDESNIRTYQLRYQLQEDVQWPLPQELTELNLFLTDQYENKISLPLPSPLNLSITIQQRNK